MNLRRIKPNSVVSVDSLNKCFRSIPVTRASVPEPIIYKHCQEHGSDKAPTMFNKPISVFSSLSPHTSKQSIYTEVKE